jgi:hypothetical protein
MLPVNVKSMNSMLMLTLEKLDNYEIDVNHALAVSKIVQTSINCHMYELKRAAVLSVPEMAAMHRNLELKNFDALPE